MQRLLNICKQHHNTLQAKELSELREELAEARGKLSGLDAVRVEAAAATRRAAQLEGAVEQLKETLAEARAEANMLREKGEEAESEHKAVHTCQV